MLDWLILCIVNQSIEIERSLVRGRGTSIPIIYLFLVSRDCCVALPHGAEGLSAVCDCSIT